MNTYRTSQRQQIERASREAAEWLQALRADPGVAEREAFVGWMKSSPLHAREMLLAQMLDRELADSGVLDGFDTDAVVARAAAESNVVPLSPRQARAHATPRRSTTRRRRGGWLRAGGAFAAACLLLVVGWAGTRAYYSAGTDYVTAIGEQRALHLADGTQVELAPDTRISVDFSSGARRITLHRGAAAFDVHHDAARPFRVYAGANMIRDIGTRFRVNRLPSGTVVSVSEGSVELSPDRLAALGDGVGAWVESWLPADVAAIARPGARVEPLHDGLRLEAGQAAHIASNGRALARGTIGSEAVGFASDGRLAFHDDTLADIAAEFNRYNTRRIVVEGDAVALQRYSGVFDANDVGSFLQFLDCCSSLVVSREGDKTVIRATAVAAVQPRSE